MTASVAHHELVAEKIEKLTEAYTREATFEYGRTWGGAAGFKQTLHLIW